MRFRTLSKFELLFSYFSQEAGKFEKKNGWTPPLSVMGLLQPPGWQRRLMRAFWGLTSPDLNRSTIGRPQCLLVARPVGIAPVAGKQSNAQPETKIPHDKKRAQFVVIRAAGPIFTLLNFLTGVYWAFNAHSQKNKYAHTHKLNISW